MRVGIVTWGTEGDVRPFFALAHALKARGHEVELVYTNVEGRTFPRLARDLGITARPVCVGYFAQNQQTIQEQTRAAGRTSDPVKQLGLIVRHLLDPVLDHLLSASEDLATRCDVMVGHFLAFPASIAARRRRLPFVAVTLQPVFASATHPPTGAPDLGPFFNRVFWRLSAFVLESVFGPRMNQMRAHVGLPPIVGLQEHGLDEARLGLVGLSPALYPRPHDWEPKAQLTGFLGVSQAAERFTPEPALQAFLDGGEPPVFFGFGSMLTLDLERGRESIAIVREAIDRAGVRAIVQAPRRLLDERSERVFSVEHVPHAGLFPLCSAVVHHGGAGTTQSVLLARKPSVIVPHAMDQFFFGDLLHARGVASEPLKRTQLSAAGLATRIRKVLDDPSITARARELGDLLAQEDGATRAAELIEQAVL